MKFSRERKRKIEKIRNAKKKMITQSHARKGCDYLPNLTSVRLANTPVDRNTLCFFKLFYTTFTLFLFIKDYLLHESGSLYIYFTFI